MTEVLQGTDEYVGKVVGALGRIWYDQPDRGVGQQASLFGHADRRLQAGPITRLQGEQEAAGPAFVPVGGAPDGQEGRPTRHREAPGGGPRDGLHAQDGQCLMDLEGLQACCLPARVYVVAAATECRHLDRTEVQSSTVDPAALLVYQADEGPEHVVDVANRR